MKVLTNWLMANKLRTFFLSLIYFALVIFPHEWVGVKINAAFAGITRVQYDLTILILFLALLLFIMAIVYQRIKDHPEKVKLVSFFGFTIACMFLVNSFLFTVNIESVHYLQYGIAAFLIFMVVENYFVSLFIAFLMGVFDEAYQYFYLAPEGTAYFDFNDIITNLLGAAFGLLILYTFKFNEKQYQKSIYKIAFLYPLIGISLLLMSLLQTNLLSVYPSSKKYMLIKKSSDSEDFEVGYGIWNDDGPDCIRSATDMEFANSGEWCIRLRNNSTSSSMTSSNLNFSSYDSVGISLSFITKGMARNDAFHVEMLSEKEKEWTALHTWLYQHDFVNGERKDTTITAKAPLRTSFRIRCNADAKNDRVYVDDIIIKGIYKTGPRFYIVKPLEGLLILAVLFLLYFFCFKTKTVEKN